MKKNFLIAGALLVMACGALTYCFASSSQPSAADATASKNEIVSSVKSPKGKILIAYFTSPETDGVDAVAGASRVIMDGNLMGNTEYVAQVIKEATGGDLFTIKTAHQYPGSHKALIDYAKKENEDKARPKLATHIDNLNDYDIIFVGFPNWWYDMPMPIYSFFDEYDFSGKTVIPFCTHGGSRFSKALQTIAGMEKDAEIVKGLSVPRDNVGQSKADVLKWLKGIGMTE